MDVYIKREKAKEAIRNYCKGAIEDGHSALDIVDTSADLVGAMDYIPAADVVEVVRCKDCVHCNSDGTICHRGIGRVTNPMGYCHNGKKMDGKGE